MSISQPIGLKSLLRGAGSAAFAATALAAVLASAPAQAVIIASGPVNILIPDDIDGVYVNLVTGASGAVPPVGWDINPYSAAEGGFHLWGATTTTWFSPSGDSGGPYPLAANTSIGPIGAFFRPGGSTDVGTQITLNAPNLFGVRFTNEATAATNFGWVRITFGATASERSITSYAYENNGTAILAGVVPEPGTYAMLLAGLAVVGGIAARRRPTPAA